MKARRTTRLLLLAIIGFIIVLALVISSKGSLSQFFSSTPKSSEALSGFVTRSGTQLMLDGHPFRFAGANMHWLTFDDSTSYTSQFRVNDGLDAAKEMGLSVVRSHNLGISVGCSNCIEPQLGVFNETALVHDDYVLNEARDHGVRLIIPLTDNWHFPEGGKHTFTDWRGISDENQFYYNTQVINDFELYISTLLNHVNTYTGIAYKNDPTIMAWETGNELDPPTSWTQTISKYIKNIDSNHLVIDGRSGVDPNAASLTNVDIVSDHYYPKKISMLMNDAKAAKKVGKAFIVGEFDWNDANGGDSLSKFLPAIEADSAISGDLFWELWPHDDQYGYTRGEIQFTLHYPGDSAAMRASVQLLRNHAYRMRQLSVPADSIPQVPLIVVALRNLPNNVLEWRGTAVAANYTIERSTVGASGPWTVICNKCATDNSTPWLDTTSPEGNVWYRVTAYNISGVAGSSSTPFKAESTADLIDNLNDWSKTYEHSSNLSFDHQNSQYMNGDPSRILRTTATHEYITWKQAGMISFQAVAYFWPSEPVSHFSIYVSTDGKSWMLSQPTISSAGNNAGGKWLEYTYTLKDLSKVSYVKLVWNNTGGHEWNPELSEVTITYQ